MTETSTPSDEVQAVREDAARVLRAVADLHAAYGKGVEMTIDVRNPAGTASTWLYLHSSGNGLTVGFWDDGDVWHADEEPEGPLTALRALDLARVFLHKHGRGAR